MKTSHKPYLVVFILAVIFLAPGILGYVYYRHPTWLNRTSTNRGQFVTPSYQLKSVEKPQHWRLIYWNPSSCSAACMHHAEDLARVRLALGRRLYQVDACLIFGHQRPVLSSKQSKILQEEDICVLKLPNNAQTDRTALGEKSAFFIVSPNNALVLTYPITVAPDDLFHDIKQLITEPS